MKKSIIALAVAGAMTAPIVAQADATLYGVSQFRLIAEDDSSLNAQQAKTRLGVKGTVDNDIEGLTTGYQIEFNLTGANGDADGVGELRKSNVYLKGGFGQATFGKQNNPAAAPKFADQLGRNSAAFSLIPDRIENAVTYVTPSLGPVKLHAGFAADGATTAGTADSEDFDAYIVGATAGVAGFDVALTYTATNSAAANSDVEVVGVGAKYAMNNFTGAVTYEDRSADSGAGVAEGDTVQAYVGYDIDKVNVGLQYEQRDLDGSEKEKKTAVALNYALGSAASLGLEYADYNDVGGKDNLVLQYTISF